MRELARQHVFGIARGVGTAALVGRYSGARREVDRITAEMAEPVGGGVAVCGERLHAQAATKDVHAHLGSDGQRAAAALGISCSDEPYTFADNQIKLTATSPDDCLIKKLKKDNAEVTSAPFDAAKNAVTLNVAVQLPGGANGQKIPFSLELDSESKKVAMM